MNQRYEYKVIPAPAKGRKGRGTKGPQARFAFGIETAINALAAEGWEYLRADILPSEERQGLTSSQTVYRSLLVFRRGVAEGAVESASTLPWEESVDDIEEPFDAAQEDVQAEDGETGDAAYGTEVEDGQYVQNTPRD